MQPIPSHDELLDELSRRNLLDMTVRLWPGFHATDFHKNYYSVLDLFCKKQIKNLIVTIPPQHGKSKGSSEMAPAFILGRNPDSHIALMSYSTTFARRFNRHLQRRIDTDEYRAIFPGTVLNAANVTTVLRGFLRNADEFEIVDHLGSFKAIGREGALTGNPVDIMIFDDLYKDAMEGNSPVVRDNVIEMYKSVAETRLHNDSQQLCVFTRWHEEDLIGWFEKNYTVITLNSLDEIADIEDQKGVWYKINYEAIKESEPTELDPRPLGEPLYPQRHSLERLQDKQSNDPNLFACMYQGNPTPKEGLLYSDFKTYTVLPETLQRKGNYTDTADQGDDFLCSVCYVQDFEDNIYITDLLHTQEPMETTEITVPMMMERNGTKDADIESNNGGRGFARVVEQKAKNTAIFWFHQSENKEARIITNAAQVNKFIYMPYDWKTRWPKFAAQVLSYKKLFKANKYHDAPDTLTGIIEKTHLATVFYFK